MPKTYEVVSPDHAVEVKECPQGGFHDWIADSGANSAYATTILPERRLCLKCNLAQIWRLKTGPNSANAPELGEWEDAL